MIEGQWYRAGTVSLKPGSVEVAGDGSLWLGQVQPGDLFTLDGERVYEVAEVRSDSAIVIRPAWAGAGLAKAPYAIVRVWGRVLPDRIAANVQWLLDEVRRKLADPLQTAQWIGEAKAAAVTAGEAIAKVTAARDQAVKSAGEAASARDVTTSARDTAGQNKVAAVTAKTEAETARTEAVTAKTAAETAKTEAVTAKTAAETARTEAVTAKTAAETARTEAVTAKTAAETAKTEAVTAKTEAETARTGAVTAKSTAETARTEAVAAKTAAETAKTEAVAAKTAAETAKTEAVAAKTAAETAKTEAVTAKGGAESWVSRSKEWADKDEDKEISENAGRFSARHWATKAQRLVAAFKMPALVAGHFLRGNDKADGWETRSPDQVRADIGALGAGGGTLTGDIQLKRAVSGVGGAPTVRVLNDEGKRNWGLYSEPNTGDLTFERCDKNGTVVDNPLLLGFGEGDVKITKDVVIGGKATVKGGMAIDGNVAFNGTVSGDAFGVKKDILGYIKLPNGIIVQWGQKAIPTGAGDLVEFPMAFPNAILNITSSDYGLGCRPTGWRKNGDSLKDFEAYAGGNGARWTSTNYSYVAIGY